MVTKQEGQRFSGEYIVSMVGLGRGIFQQGTWRCWKSDFRQNFLFCPIHVRRVVVCPLQNRKWRAPFLACSVPRWSPWMSPREVLSILNSSPLSFLIVGFFFLKPLQVGAMTLTPVNHQYECICWLRDFTFTVSVTQVE